MENTRTHIVMPISLVKEIDQVVGKRARSGFLTSLAERELIRLKQLSALRGARGAWKDADHPEWKHGSVKWVRKMRKESDNSLQKMIKRTV